jgi:hypothetical protein
MLPSTNKDEFRVVRRSGHVPLLQFDKHNARLACRVFTKERHVDSPVCVGQAHLHRHTRVVEGGLGYDLR